MIGGVPFAHALFAVGHASWLPLPRDKAKLGTLCEWMATQPVGATVGSTCRKGNVNAQ